MNKHSVGLIVSVAAGTAPWIFGADQVSSSDKTVQPLVTPQQEEAWKDIMKKFENPDLVEALCRALQDEDDEKRYRIENIKQYLRVLRPQDIRLKGTAPWIFETNQVSSSDETVQPLVTPQQEEAFHGETVSDDEIEYAYWLLRLFQMHKEIWP
jgi:hypothetical protein